MEGRKSVGIPRSGSLYSLYRKDGRVSAEQPSPVHHVDARRHPPGDPQSMPSAVARHRALAADRLCHCGLGSSDSLSRSAYRNTSKKILQIPQRLPRATPAPMPCWAGRRRTSIWAALLIIRHRVSRSPRLVINLAGRAVHACHGHGWLINLLPQSQRRSV